MLFAFFLTKWFPTGYVPPVTDEPDVTLRKISLLKAKPDNARKLTLMSETLADRRQFLTQRKCSLKKLQDRYPDLFQVEEVRIATFISFFMRMLVT